MTPERWQQIKNLVNSVVAENADKRAAVLQQSCGSDPARRLGAEALLSLHHDETRKLPSAAMAATRRWAGSRCARGSCWMSEIWEYRRFNPGSARGSRAETDATDVLR